MEVRLSNSGNRLKSMLRNDSSKQMADQALPIQRSDSGEQVDAILMSIVRTEFPDLLPTVLEQPRRFADSRTGTKKISGNVVQAP